MRATLIIWGVIFGLLWPAQSHGGKPVSEADLRAAMIYNIAKFVTWPSTPAGNTLDLCVVGAEGEFESFNQIQNKKIGNTGLQVHAHNKSDSLIACEIIYYAEPELTHAVPGALTVSDHPSFIDENGIVAIHRVGNKLVFSVNRENAETANIKISSKLLQLAETVK